MLTVNGVPPSFTIGTELRSVDPVDAVGSLIVPFVVQTGTCPTVTVPDCLTVVCAKAPNGAKNRISEMTRRRIICGTIG